HSALQVAGTVDDPHSPAAEDPDDLVPVELRPGRYEPGDGRALKDRRGRDFGARLDRAVDFEQVAKGLRQVGEPGPVIVQLGRLPTLPAQEDFILDEVEKPLRVGGETGVLREVEFGVKRLAELDA